MPPKPAAAVSSAYTYAPNQEVWVWDERAGWGLGTVSTVDPAGLTVKLKTGKVAKKNPSNFFATIYFFIYD